MFHSRSVAIVAQLRNCTTARPPVKMIPRDAIVFCRRQRFLGGDRWSSGFFPWFSEMKNFRDAGKFRTFGGWKKKIHATGLSLTELPNRKKRSHRIIKRVGRNERARREQRCHRTLWLEEHFLRTEIFSARKLFLQEIYERALRDHGSRPWPYTIETWLCNLAVSPRISPLCRKNFSYSKCSIEGEKAKSTERSRVNNVI